MTKQIKIDVVVVPLSGHLYPTLNLLKPLLNDPRYSIRVFTGPQKQAVAEEVGFHVVPILEDHVETFERVSNNEDQLTIWTAYRQLSNSLDLINLVSDQLEQEWTSNRPDIVIADFITISAGLVAEKLHIPWITTMATQFAIETTDGPPCFFGGLGSPKNKLEEWQQWLGRKVTRGAKRCVTFCLRNRLRRYDFRLYNDKKEETIYSPYSILGIGLPELELKSGFPSQYKWIGPTGTSLEKGGDYPLDLSPYFQRKKVFVSSGTQLPWAKENLIKQTRLLAKQHPDCQFLLTLGIGADSFSQQVIEENMTILSYLPYKEYLPQMDYVIHHGGAGIFYQCIEFEKPALILPHDYDQYDYAIRGVEAGVAFTARRDDSQEIGHAFEQMIHQDKWPQLSTLSQRIKEINTQKILKTEIERIIYDRDE